MIGQFAVLCCNVDFVRKKLGAKDAAAMVGVKPNTWRAYVAREQAPAPDGREEISGTPWWWESTVKRFRDSRPGQGARTDLA